MKRLREILGVNQKVGLKAGDAVVHPIYGFETKVVAIYEDFLGNERVLTEHAKRHIEEEIQKKRGWKSEIRREGLKRLGEILKEPSMIIEDTRKGSEAIIYLKKINLSGKTKYVGVVIGRESRHYIYTVQPMSGRFDEKRYIKLYEAETS